jgi:GcrA cell cycle regulator
VTGLPYCEFHSRRAFQPVQPRRRDRIEHPMVSIIQRITPAPAAQQPQQPSPAKEPVDA